MALKDNLISHWKLDESSDGSSSVTRNDSHGTNHLTDNNNTASATGILSNGANFVGANSETLSITDASQSGLDISGDFTVSFWMKATSVLSVGSFGHAVINKYLSTGNLRGYQVIIPNNTDGGQTAMRLEVGVSQDGTTTNFDAVCTRSAMITSADVGVWRHFVVYYNLAARSVKVYKDGQPQAVTVRANLGTMTNIFNNARSFFIGVANESSTYTDAVLDEVSLWSREVYPDEVQKLWNNGVPLSYDDWEGYSFWPVTA
jgi:hypothetical protein